MSDNSVSPIERARRFRAGVENRDLSAIEAVVAPQAKFWTNVTQTDTDRVTRLATIAVEFRLFKTFSFENTRVGDFGTGFVVRAQARGSLGDGQQFAFPLCIVGDVDDGAIVRLEEYFDPSAVAPILGAMAAEMAAAESR